MGSTLCPTRQGVPRERRTQESEAV